MLRLCQCPRDKDISAKILKSEALFCHEGKGIRQADLHVSPAYLTSNCLQRLHEVQEESDEIREANQAVTKVYTSNGNIFLQTPCSKLEDQDYHKLKCLERERKDCEVHDLVLLPEEKGVGNHQVKWKQYDYVLTGKLNTDGKEMKNQPMLRGAQDQRNCLIISFSSQDSFPTIPFLLYCMAKGTARFSS